MLADEVEQELATGLGEGQIAELSFQCLAPLQRGRRTGNIRLGIAFLSLRIPRDYGYETLQSLPRSTWFNRASEVDASVLLEVV